MDRIWTPWRSRYVETSGKTDNRCVFCHPDDDADCFITRTELSSVILNKFPYNGGHMLVSPLRHVADLDMLTDDESSELLLLVKKSVAVLKQAFNPQGFNVGMNLGSAAGAGIAGHLHMHVVPRWNGDASFMPVIADTRVIPFHIKEIGDRIRPMF